jgi:hypothetical protein
MEWSGATPVTSGHRGPLLFGVQGDSMLVNNVLVEAL